MANLFFFLSLISLQANELGLKSVSLSLQDASLFEMLESIEEQTGVGFLYSESEINTAQKISVIAQNKPLGDLLSDVLPDLGVDFEIEESVIVLTARTEQKEAKVVEVVEKKAEEKIKIKGKITDKDGSPLPGATVIEEGVLNGVISDTNGDFTIEVADASTVLKISYIGFITQRITVGDKTTLNIVLEESATSLNEVVVTGYQTLSVERVTGSFSRIDTEELDRTTSFSLEDKLEGTASGLLFDPLGLTIRGVSTLQASRIPLIVLNGFPLQVSVASNSSTDEAELEALQRALESINPNDVESVTVLKDAAATSIWGSRAANGVIVITTKIGTTTEPEINFNFSFGGSPKPDVSLLPFANPQTHLEIEKGRYEAGWMDSRFGLYDRVYMSLSDYHVIQKKINDGTATVADLALVESAMGSYDNRYEFSDLFLRNSFNQQYDFSISQRVKYINYRFSVSHNDNNSTSVGQKTNRTVINVFMQYRPKDWISFDFNSNLNIRNDINNGVDISELYEIAQHQPILDGNGNYTSMSTSNYFIRDRTAREEIVENNDFFPYDWHWNIKQEFDNKNNKVVNNDYRIMGGIQLKPLGEMLVFNVKYQYERGVSDIQKMYNQETFFVRDLVNTYAQSTSLPVPKGNVFDQFYQTSQFHNLRATAQFRKLFSTDHYVTLLAGADLSDQFSDESNNRRYGYNPQTLAWATQLDYQTRFPRNLQSSDYTIDSPGSARDRYLSRQDRFLSYFVNSSYTYKKRYDLTASIRLDKSNSFGDSPQYREVPLWSLGAGWTIDQEDFFQVDFVNRLRLRATYGVSGNIDKTTSPYAIAAVGNIYNNPTMGIDGASYLNPANPELRWEKTTQTNVAFDFSVWNNRIDGTVDLYSKSSKDLLTNMATNSIYGFNQALINFGSMRNRGVELSLSGMVVDRNVKWRTLVLYSYNDNQVTQTDPIDFDALNSVSFIFTNPNNRIVEGRPRYNLVSLPWGGLSPSGYPQFFQGETLHNSMTTALSERDFGFENLLYNGAMQAPHFGSWNNIISHKGLELSVLLTFKFGHYYMHNGPFRMTNNSFFGTIQGNFITHYAEEFENMWREPGDEDHTDIPRLPFEYDPLVRNKKYYELAANYGSQLIESASHIRLSRITLAYSLPVKWIKPAGLNNLTVSLQGRNLGVLAFNKFGEDPENQPDMLGRFITKKLPEYTFSIRMNF